MSEVLIFYKHNKLSYCGIWRIRVALDKSAGKEADYYIFQFLLVTTFVSLILFSNLNINYFVVHVKNCEVLRFYFTIFIG